MRKSIRSLKKTVKRFGDIFGGRRASQRAKMPRTRRPQLEPLEDRQMLSITVNSPYDNTDADQYTTLREALVLADPGDDIVFDFSSFPEADTITLNGNQLEITKNVTIDGSGVPGLTIDADNSSRVFNVYDAASALNVTISDMTITGGYATDADNDGGGIYNRETLTLNKVTITGNEADDRGGGIYNYYGIITAQNSIISQNEASEGGGIYGFSGTVTLENVTDVSYNESTSYGGGIRMSCGTLNLTGNSTVENNDASGNGGGIFASGSGSSSYVNITNSTILDNTAATNGGGICVGNAEVEITNSVIEGNELLTISAVYGGGGIFANNSTVDVIGSVISCNSANYGGGICGFASTGIDVDSSTIAGNIATVSGGGINTAGNLYVDNTIISLNQAPSGNNIQGTTPTGGNNLIDKDSSEIGFVSDPDSGDNGWDGVDDYYGNLQLLPNSDAEAIDAGNNNLVSGEYDLAGNARIFNDIVDIGAYEYQYEIVVTTLEDETTANGYTSLREALAAAAATSDAERIIFDDSLEGTITLNGTELLIDSDVTIEGPGADKLTINADTDDDDETSESRVFKVYDAASTLDVTISGMAITGGYATGADDDGGGIYNAETLTLNNVTVTSNKSDGPGGGIHCASGSVISLENETFVSNNVSTASTGGGIYAATGAAVDIINSTISGNEAGTYGGGICAFNTVIDITSNSFILDNESSSYGGGGIYAHNTDVNVIGSTVSGNNSSTGGGIAGISGAIITIEDSTVSDNQSTSNGGGIRLYSGCALIVEDGSTISGNESTGESGGGIYGHSSTTITVTNSTVAGNTANVNGGGIYGSTDATINLTNSSMVGNSATNGGAIYGYDAAEIELTNATIAGNYAAASGGGIYYDSTNGTLTAGSTVIAKNEKGTGTDEDIYGTHPANADVFIEEDDDDPGFIRDPYTNGGDDYGNLRPDTDSDLLDAGNNDDASGINYDLDGNTRIVNSTVDIGAYENQYIIVTTPHRREYGQWIYKPARSTGNGRHLDR